MREEELEWLKGEEELDEVLELELELLKLLDMPLAGDTKCGTCGKVFDTKKLLYFMKETDMLILVTAISATNTLPAK